MTWDKFEQLKGMSDMWTKCAKRWSKIIYIYKSTYAGKAVAVDI